MRREYHCKYRAFPTSEVVATEIHLLQRSTFTNAFRDLACKNVVVRMDIAGDVPNIIELT
jgi:hypothetical protein